ncbi:centrosomal protein of 97 kDa isoform X2 [Cimex lectularius]|nr:centrosomal protein of 97 kDa isoform X2 [Cimex lectularius]
MYPVAPLHHLVRLDLSHNNIMSIEGLKELVHLSYLNLSSNKIKVIEHLNTNLQLEHLDLSDNFINSITNISQLTKLKKLLLHKNMIVQLRHCEILLPTSLESLTLAANKINDLNEISHLSSLQSLRDISIVSNPCVEMTGNAVGFDYRPFLVNWCTSLKCIDGFVVDDIESLKGEWLYSQGRGRQFKPGQHAELVQYLVETCSLNNENLQSEHERKLRLILSKAHHHQSQLRMSEQPGSASGKLRSSISELMSRSLDPTLLDSCSTHITDKKLPDVKSENVLTRSLHCEPVTTREIDKMVSYATPSPLPAASKLVPVPESLISPMVTNTPPLVMQNVNSDTVSPCKLQTIKNKAQQKRVKRGITSDREQAAIYIQKMWRGYQTRNLNPKVLSIYQHLQTRRTYQYIQKLSEDMEATRAALDSEHKLQLLQMQAINALWKKVVSLQPAKLDESIGEVKDLAQTCDRLNIQVQQLQSCMQEVLRCVSPSSGSAMGTQTDISAVRTPCTESNDTKFLHCRPSTLSLPPQKVTQYADGLVDGVMKDTVVKDSVPVSETQESLS